MTRKSVTYLLRPNKPLKSIPQTKWVEVYPCLILWHEEVWGVREWEHLEKSTAAWLGASSLASLDVGESSHLARTGRLWDSTPSSKQPPEYQQLLRSIGGHLHCAWAPIFSCVSEGNLHALRVSYGSGKIFSSWRDFSVTFVLLQPNIRLKARAQQAPKWNHDRPYTCQSTTTGVATPSLGPQFMIFIC